MPLTTRACAYARRSENYSIDKRVGLGLWALPLPPLPPYPPHMYEPPRPMVDIFGAPYSIRRSKGFNFHLNFQRNDDGKNDDEDEDDGSYDDDDTNCTKLLSEMSIKEREFWRVGDPCSPDSPPSPPPPDPSPPPPLPPPNDDDEDDDEDCTKRSPLDEFMNFWGEKDPCAPESPPLPPPPDPSPPPPSLPLMDGIAELLEDDDPDDDYARQRAAYESEASEDTLQA